MDGFGSGRGARVAWVGLRELSTVPGAEFLVWVIVISIFIV